MEVAAAGDGLVRVRDSKDPDGPQIIISAGFWRESLRQLITVPDAAGDCLVAASVDGWMLLRDARQPAGAVLRFTPGEWNVFLRGARDGEFDLTPDDSLRPVPPVRRLRELSAAGCPLLGDVMRRARVWADGTVHAG